MVETHCTPYSCPDLLRTPFEAEVAGHSITLYPFGPDRLNRLVELIDVACASVDVLYYTFEEDDAGTRVRDALAAAAGRGVKVRLLVDSFGSSGTKDVFFEPLRQAGGSARWFGTRWTPRYLIRNHQKLAVIDRATVMAGGFNIGKDYFGEWDCEESWQDMGFVLAGPAVDDAAAWFDSLSNWMDAPRPRFRDLRRIIRMHDSGDKPVRWLVGGPTARLSPLARALKREMISAKRMAFSTAYFSPDGRFMSRIGKILRRGGKVDIVLPSKSDNGATIGASRLLYKYLLKRGARIAEFAPCRLHNKLCVIDDTVLVGSANFDMRSLFLNMELMLRVEDKGLADHCRAIIQAQRDSGTVITRESHRKNATLFNRFRWALCWLVVATMDYGITRRLNFGLK